MLNIGLIDVMNLVKRNVYANLKTFSDNEKDGISDEVLLNVINKIKNTIVKLHLDIIFLINDNGTNKRAKAIYSDYKANRNKYKTLTETEKENSIIEYYIKILKSLPFPYLEVRNTESDNIIYFLTERIKKLFTKDYKIYIISTDTDMFQMINNNIYCYDMYKDRLINKENIFSILIKEENKIILPVKDYVLMKSIVGDISDNIKGVKSVGWKTIVKLFIVLRDYTDVIFENHYNLRKEIENILDYNEKIIKKDKEYLIKLYKYCNDNMDILNRNIKLIDLSFLESATIFETTNAIDISFNNECIFDYKIFKKLLNFNSLSYGDERDIKIKEKMNNFIKFFNKYSIYLNKKLEILKEKNNE